MKFQSIVILVLLAAVVLGGFYYDNKVSRLETKLAEKMPADTVKVVVTLTDTVYTEKADTVLASADTTIVNDTVHIDHYKNLVGITEQPLFKLKVTVNTKAETFGYDFKYNPLNIYLEFKDKYDLRKGFLAYTVPDVGSVNVDFGQYKPLKKKLGVGISGGAFYSNNSPGLMAGIFWKKNELGVTFTEGSKGFYYRRILLEL